MLCNMGGLFDHFNMPMTIGRTSKGCRLVLRPFQHDLDVHFDLLIGKIKGIADTKVLKLSLSF